MQNPFFKQIENKTGVSMEEIFALANAIQHADFTNEKQVRKIIRRVSKVANKPVTKELEDQIVKSIVQDGKSLDLGKIQKMLG
ncbi:stage VI sporulation protein F [Ureibacillus aquaedulcis]|uniref:Stage VI sporulation protein F n=1 Tax=Ureibacillus aquaedulcis TaxID=3058421 RepID=A0ABT8GLM1_9BACL|nr:stage VI sporulation protein F [Ureibacillus sp. BA0131]MDN4492313.1 stage VI sporulation protein F [Ureibacillus sp. BA0131]